METGQNLSISFRKHVFALDIYLRNTLPKMLQSLFKVFIRHGITLVLVFIQMTGTYKLLGGSDICYRYLLCYQLYRTPCPTSHLGGVYWYRAAFSDNFFAYWFIIFFNSNINCKLVYIIFRMSVQDSLLAITVSVVVTGRGTLLQKIIWGAKNDKFFFQNVLYYKFDWWKKKSLAAKCCPQQSKRHLWTDKS